MKKKVLNWLIISIIILIITSIFYMLVPRNQNVEIAEAGEFRYSNDGVVPLDGEWEFIWSKLLTPDEFDQLSSFEKSYEKIPGMWNKYKSIPWNLYEEKGKGYATFRLIVKNLNVQERYAFRVRNLGTAGKIFINGEQLIEMGTVSDDPTKAKSDYSIHYVAFDIRDPELEIVVQISNYEYARGGFWVPLYFGSEEDIYCYKDMNQGKDYLILGILLAVLLVSITIGFNSRGNTGSIYLFFGTILVMIYVGVTGDKLLMYWFPGLKENVIRLQYLVMYLSPVALSGYIKSILSIKRKYFKYFHYAVVIYSSMMIIYVFGLSIYEMTKLTYFGNITTDFFIGYMILVLIIEAIFYNSDTILLIIGFYTLSLGVTYDFLYQSTLIQSSFGELTTVTYVIFIIMMTMFLAKHIKKVYDATAIIPTLEQAYYNAQIKPHFLFNVLNSIVALIHRDSKSAEEMTLNLSTHLRNILGIENLDNKINIQKELEFLEAYADLEQIRFKDLEIVISYDEALQFNIPPYTLQPLVENAIKHGFKTIHEYKRIEVNIYKHSEDIVVEVIDNGIGIPIEKLKRLNKMLNDHLSMVNHKIGNQHIGLINVNHRLYSALDTTLEIESVEGKGTKVYFKFKYKK